MKEAALYQKLKDNVVRCNLCAHRCLIADGKRGICSVRENRGGILYSLVYGKAMAANVDPIEKKPFFHFLPGSQSFSIATAGCNFRCSFCQNWDISQILRSQNSLSRGEGAKFLRSEIRRKADPRRVLHRKKFLAPDQSDAAIPGEPFSPEEIVQQALLTGCQSIAYTYTEPTIFFEYAIDTAKLAKKKGLANVFVTNGYQTAETIKEMKGLIDAANIDLKSSSDEFYRKICGARLPPVLESIKRMHQAGIWIEITTLVVPNQNDSPEELTQIAQFIASVDKNIPWHLSRFHPDYKMLDSSPTPLKTLEKAYQIGKKAGLNYVYIGNIITETYENTYCPFCKTLAVKRIGYETQILTVDKNGKCQKCGEDLKIKL